MDGLILREGELALPFFQELGKFANEVHQLIVFVLFRNLLAEPVHPVSFVLRHARMVTAALLAEGSGRKSKTG